MKILMIDDDPELGELTKQVLGMYAYQVDLAYTPAEGLEKLQHNAYDLILLDIMLPEINGLEVCRKIRGMNNAFAGIPIIIVSARTELVDLVVGLETGADDYVGKPFEPRELIARINAVMRRTKKAETTVQPHEHVYVFDHGNDKLTINVATVEVTVNGVLLELTSAEFDILSTLGLNYGKVLNHDELAKLSKNVDPMYPESLVSMIYRLRSKIKSAGAESEFIRTVRNKGYSIAGVLNN